MVIKNKKIYIWKNKALVNLIKFYVVQLLIPNKWKIYEFLHFMEGSSWWYVYEESNIEI